MAKRKGLGTWGGLNDALNHTLGAAEKKAAEEAAKIAKGAAGGANKLGNEIINAGRAYEQHATAAGQVQRATAPKPQPKIVDTYNPPGPSEQSAPAPAADPVPDPNVDPRGFQHYLNVHFNAGLVEDGKVGPKTKAAAARFGVAIPTPAAPAPADNSTPTDQAPAAAPADNNAPPPAATPPGLSADQIAAAMQIKYGWLGSLLSNPDIKAALTTAIQQGLDPNSIEAQSLLLDTPTFQGKSSKDLTWMEMKAPDQQLAVQKATDTISADAARLGITIDPTRLSSMAQDAAKYGWSSGSPELTKAIAAEFHYKPGAQTGAVGSAETSIRKMASQYMMSLSDDTLANWDQQIAAGTATPEQFRQGMIDYAKTKFPALTSMLDQGMTVQDIGQSYAQTAGSVLGINPDSVQFTDPKWSRALSNWDPNQGKFTMMNDYDWQKTLKTDPVYDWQHSQPGKDQAYMMINGLQKAFGE